MKLISRIKSKKRTTVQAIILLLAITSISCTKNKEDDIHYSFPNRIDEISGERAHITDIKYKVGLFESNDKSTCPTDSIIIFRKNGKIFNSQRQIGHWKKDGTLYLNYFKKRFFFNWITPKSCDGVLLFTKYRIDNHSKWKMIKLFTKNASKKDVIKYEGEDEFDL
jgi:hypothetical protein